MAKTFAVANWFKKTLNPTTGAETGRTPMLFRTLSTLVFRSNGHTVEADIATLETNVANAAKIMTFQTEAAYNAAYTAGDIPAGTIGIITGE